MGNGLFPGNHLVIPTGAQRSGGICGFLFQFSHTFFSPLVFGQSSLRTSISGKIHPAGRKPKSLSSLKSCPDTNQNSIQRSFSRPALGGCLLHQFVGVTDGNRQVGAAEIVQDGEIYANYFAIAIEEWSARSARGSRRIVNNLVF